MPDSNYRSAFTRRLAASRPPEPDLVAESELPGDQATALAESERAPEAEQPVSEPALVEVFTDRDRFFAEVDLGQERLTDILNREGSVQAFRIDRFTDEPNPHTSVALSVDSILLAIAPPQNSPTGRRLHRPRHWVEMHVGEHEVWGNLHVPAGAQPGGYLLRVNPKFVALTEAEVHNRGGEYQTEVVIVNVRQVDRMKEIGRNPRDYAGDFPEEY